MSKKISEFPITPLDFSADWSDNKIDHLPQSGEQVNAFLNDSLRDVARACWFDPASYTLLFFRSDDDKQTYIDNPSSSESLVVYRQVLSFTGTVRRVNIINETGTTTINATTNMDNVPIEFGYQLVEKGVTESQWRILEDSATIIVYADNGSGYHEIFRKTGVEHSDPAIELNIRQYLVSGANKIRVTAIANDSESTTGNLTYNVTLAEMYVENFPGRSYWYRAVVEGMSPSLYQLGGFKIVGILNKTIHFDIYSANDPDTLILHKEKVIGNSQYINYEYSYNYAVGLRLDELDTGSYIAKVYLTAGLLSTKDNAIEYPFMYVRQADALTAQLVTIANVTKTIFNGESNILCEYAAYNAGLSTASPTRTVQQYRGVLPYGSPFVFDSVVDTNSSYQLECDILIEDETAELGYLKTEITIELGSSEVTAQNLIDNSATYPPVSGYDFSMNPSLRSNGEAHPEYVINNVSGSQCTTVEWTKMAFVDGIDGWTIDDEGRTCLRIPAGGKMSLPFSFFKFLNNSNQGRNTVEICYKILNVSDYNENCITIAINPTASGFTGIRIRPNNILAHSSADTSSDNDSNRGTNLSEGQTVDFMLAIEPDFTTGKNLVTGFIDGCKNFQFEYSGNFNFNANLIIGSDTADVYVYALRHYANSLRQDSAEKNFISTILDRATKLAENAKMNSVIDSSHDITLDKVQSGGYNYFVVDMKNGATIPSKKNGWDKSTTGQSTLEMHYGNHPEMDFKVDDVETGGQGTTSMNYWLWNLRFRLDKWPEGIPVPEAYQDDSGKYNKKRPVYYKNQEGEWDTPTDSKSVWFDGSGANPAVKRITAKINFASSMQSHKMGATYAYSLLHSTMYNGLLLNEAQVKAQTQGTPVPSVAVYEYPAFGFQKLGDEYVFIGLFTIGPDKGDKPTFGYDISDFEDSLITIEGTDHTPRLALFGHPWDNDVEYRASNECLNIVTGITEQDLDGAWEVSNCGGLSTDDPDDQEAIQTMLETEFKPAYDCAYNNSTLIFPVALSDPNFGGATASEVLANINADILTEDSTFWNAHYQGVRFPNSSMEFWIEGEYVLYHYSPRTKQYEAGINLVTQCGTPEGDTLDTKNEYFKTYRRGQFKANAANYWDIDDAIFCLCFLLIFGATDNFAKNSYPYKFKSLANGGRWRWRQDDLDTIFDIDNNGGQTKPYWIEYADTDDGGGIYFAGSSSTFWNLLYECFFDDYTVGGQTKRGIGSYGGEMLTTMQNLTSQSRVYEGALAFITRYFWDKAQKYFPTSSYNVDGQIKYEDAWANQESPTVPPLTQSLGSHFLAEQRWVKFRLLYVISLFRVGPFAQYTDTTFGAISFRPVSLPSLTITLGCWLYPTVLIGQGGSMGTSRVEEGQTKTFTGFSGEGQTTYIIQASNFITDLGDLCKLILGSQDAGTLNLSAERLKKLKIGDETAANVESNITHVNFTNTPSLAEIDARNTLLSGALDLRNCPRVREVLLEGSQVSSVQLKTGAKIETLHLSEGISELILKKTKFLSDLDVPDWGSIVTLEMEECNAISTADALAAAFNADNSLLEIIDLKWNTVDVVASAFVNILANIADNKTKTGEERIYDANIEGIFKLDGPHYESDFEKLQFEEVTPSSMTGYKEAVTTIFNKPLRAFFVDKLYIPFADAAVLNAVKSAWGDGTGVSYDQVSTPTTIPTLPNTITEFNELGLFTNVKSIADNKFNSFASLKSIDLTNITTIGKSAFRNADLSEVDLNMPNLTTIVADSLNFYGNPYDLAPFVGSKIKSIVNLGRVKYIPGFSYTSDAAGTFEGCIIQRAILPSTLLGVGNRAFYGCSKLEYVEFQEGVTTIGRGAFYHCTLMDVNFLPKTIQRISNRAFTSCKLSNLVLDLPNLIEFSDVSQNPTEPPFSGTQIKEIKSLGNITRLDSYGYGSPEQYTNGVFQYCSKLEKVHLPATITSVGSYSFRGCTSLTMVIIDAVTPPTLGSYTVFSTTPEIYVPDGSVTAYQEATRWSSYASHIHPMSELPE